jgi:hypothetical protein
MKAKKGYKWQATEDHIQPLSERWNDVGVIRRDWYGIDGPGRKLVLFRGYAWNGASGIPDDRKVVRGSGVHDALYQEMRLGGLDHNKYRNAADLELKDICISAGMWKARAYTIYLGVRVLANFAIDPGQESKVMEVP